MIPRDETRISKAMLLAAGKGTRLGLLTADRPKPMLPVGGRPLLEHTLLQVAACGIQHVGINLHHHADVVRQHFGDGSRYGVRIEYSHEPQLLGTSGGVKKLEEFIGGASFLVMYGDNLTSCNLNRLMQVHREHGGIATIALFWKEDVSPHSAVEIQANARITRFIEKPKPESAPSHWISAGVIVCDPRILSFIPASTPSDFGFRYSPRASERYQS